MGMQGPGGEVGVPLSDTEMAKLSMDQLKAKIDSATAVPPEIVTLFTYHKPTPEQEESYKAIRAAGMMLAKAIHDHCPGGPDRTAAVRKIREAVMTANASIATGNAQYR